MRIWIDGDGCPVISNAIAIAKSEKIPVTVVKNHAVQVKSDYAEIVTVDVTRDAADFYIVNHMKKYDVVVSQDYGLAAMVLSKQGICVNQNGREVTVQNIDLILTQRHHNRVDREKNKKYTKFKKRTKEDDIAFEDAFKLLIRKNR